MLAGDEGSSRTPIHDLLSSIVHLSQTSAPTVVITAALHCEQRKPYRTLYRTSPNVALKSPVLRGLDSVKSHAIQWIPKDR